MTVKQQLAELRSLASGLPTEFIACRDVGHAWTNLGSYLPDAARKGLYVRTLKCQTCSAKRHDRITSTGTVYGRRYEYPEDYQIKGFGQMTSNRTIFRRIGMERAGVLTEGA